MNLNFVVPGFSKCGTTTLCALLNDHPDIFIPPIKEPNFFAFNYDKGWDHFQSLFNGARKDQLLGEGSTTYSTGEFGELAATRIAARFPDIRKTSSNSRCGQLPELPRRICGAALAEKLILARAVEERLKMIPALIVVEREKIGFFYRGDKNVRMVVQQCTKRCRAAFAKAGNDKI